MPAAPQPFGNALKRRVEGRPMSKISNFKATASGRPVKVAQRAGKPVAARPGVMKEDRFKQALQRRMMKGRTRSIPKTVGRRTK